MKRFAMAGSALGLLGIAVGLILIGLKGNGVNLDGIDCVVHPRAPVVAETSQEYKGGRIYFCCLGCPGVFNDDPSKFAARANRQLVATSQARQHKCPLCGRELEVRATSVLAGAKVGFCGSKCQRQAEALEGDEQLELVFGEEAFKRGEFTVSWK